MSWLFATMFDATLKHGAKFIALTLEWRYLFGGQCINFSGDLQLGRNFCQRSLGNEEKLHGLFSCLASITFCDVAAHAYCSPAKLVAQSKVG